MENYSAKTEKYHILPIGNSVSKIVIIYSFFLGQPIDEVVRLYYNVNLGKYDDPDDIDLRISLKTGLAWKTYHEKQAALATDEQIETMILYLRITIKKIKQRMIQKMVNR